MLFKNMLKTLDEAAGLYGQFCDSVKLRIYLWH